MVTVDSDDVILEKYGRFIIVMFINGCAILGVLINVPNSYAGVTLVWSIIPMYGVNTDGGKA